MPQNTTLNAPAPTDDTWVTFWIPIPDAMMVSDFLPWAEVRAFALKRNQQVVPFQGGYTLACWDHTRRPRNVRPLRAVA